MATLTASPAVIRKGTPITFVGDGFAASTKITLACPALGFASQQNSDASGLFGSDDAADRAISTLTSNGTDVTANDTVTIDAVTYTFKASVTTTANEVKIGGTAAATLVNLKKAINLTGVGGTDYGSSTVVHPTCAAGAITATTLKVYVKAGGTGGNSLATTKSATTLSWPGGTFNSGTPGSAATGISPLQYAAESAGTWVFTATDGTDTASVTVVVWS